MTETSTATPETASPELLDALVGQVARLAGAAGVPPRRVRLRAGELSVEVDWPDLGDPAAPGPTTPPAGAPVTGDRTDGPPDAGAAQGTTRTLDAPLVGVFYRSPEPGADPFVREGDVLAEGQQVGIVEAMKLMNPMEADLPGRVVEFLVADGESVEYGQPVLVLETGGAT
ncbi:acetyl-CoA carboxylase biotin carboxyl carrier protein [Actinomadura algeriensis]|uniref:Biotin carboxyl carrier protein of acetyl-CoA carboxylase n=1 Tax=Actinomadura algeriensis TaxID=1679523 RepID=A0ABR9JIX0_9ACTN|nr:biotin/lipoyl-containing protein [Actinomadura algeriensis]MBE1530498.1 acetyl-CoA carboxylase biotin carboxyl carrier protein [Actinomadura algeriensis]